VANVDGKQFLQNLQKFKERQIRQQAIAQYQAMEASGFVDSTRQRDDIFHQLLPSIIRNHAEAIPPAAYNMGPLGLLDTDQRTHPYILDWYYMCHSQHTDRTEVPHFDEESPETGQDTSPLGMETSEIEEAENNYSDLYGRVQSHMGASTSSTLFRPVPPKHHGKEDSSTGNWWYQAPAYSHDPQGSFREPPEFGHHNVGPQSSFLEPPEFGNYNMAGGSHSSHHSGDISEGSEGGPEQSDNRSSSSWRNPQALYKTRYMDDSYMEEGLGLHFADSKDEDQRTGVADAYDRTPAGLPVRIIPRSSDPL
jgi:autophagy-related protein 9